MAITHVVRRTFPAKGGKLITGQCVDPSSWRWGQKLEDADYIAPIPAKVKPLQAEDGTWWENERLARARDAKSGVKSSSPLSVDESEPETPVGLFPVKVGRGKYKLSDGEIFEGNRTAAEAAESILGD